MVPPAGGVGQGAQVVPHDKMLMLLFATHVTSTPVPQTWKPVLQLTPHDGPLQTGFPLFGSVQAVHEVGRHPEPTLLSAMHALPQA